MVNYSKQERTVNVFSRNKISTDRKSVTGCWRIKKKLSNIHTMYHPTTYLRHDAMRRWNFLQIVISVTMILYRVGSFSTPHNPHLEHARYPGGILDKTRYFDIIVSYQQQCHGTHNSRERCVSEGKKREKGENPVIDILKPRRKCKVTKKK